MRAELHLDSSPIWGKGSASMPGLLLGGDVMLARGVGKILDSRGLATPFSRELGDHFPKDVGICNLEATISALGAPSSAARSPFRASPGCELLLRDAGIRIAGLANNHILDYGVSAALDTIDRLVAVGITPIGAGRCAEEARQPAIVEFGESSRAGVLAYSALATGKPARGNRGFAIAPARLEWMADDVERLSRRVDAVIVSVHWGYEGVEYPMPESRSIARSLEAAGATIVFGHHPHVVQGIETLERGVAAYSLGDWVFDRLTDERRRAILLRVLPDGGSRCRIQPIPIWRTDNLESVPAKPNPGNQILKDISDLSSLFDSGESDGMFWRSAGAAFLHDQRTGWRDALRKEGLRAIVSRLQRFRLRHLRLMWNSLRDLRRREP